LGRSIGRPFHCDFSNALRQAGRSEAEINTPAHRHHLGGDRLGGGALVCSVFRKGESVVNHVFEGRSRSPIGNSDESGRCPSRVKSGGNDQGGSPFQDRSYPKADMRRCWQRNWQARDSRERL
jgi:hypothetical protein